MRPFSAVVLAGFLLAACGATSTPGAEDRADPPTRVEYLARAVTVLDNGTDGPQMCAVVLTSLPPQCSGPAVTGWDWDDVGHEDLNGVRWGEFDLVGTWDDGSLTLTAPPAAPSHVDDEPGPDFTSPCPDARPVGHATHEDVDAAVRVADRLDGVADVWLDQNLGDEEPGDGLLAEEKANDPNRIILTVSTTGDRAAAETAIRAVWPGRLCVVQAVRSRQELVAISDQVQQAVAGDPAGSVSSSTGFGHVDVTVWLDVDGELQSRFDAEHGRGVVRVTSVLQPRRAGR